jgi:rSAM/selenodomain-associated transferase 2/rSAM/selenodomain-associated transferase 1
MNREHLIVFTRYPEPGKAKTRLIPALGSVGAAELHRQMTEHTLAQVKALQKRRCISTTVCFDGFQNSSVMQTWLGDSWTYRSQGSGDLGSRLIQALTTAFHEGMERVLVIGTDCPGLSADLMAQAFDQLQNQDLVLGPALDGGYYLIGLNRLVPELFTNIAWSTDVVLQQTIKIAREQHLSVAYLPALSDVDRPEDLPVWEQFQQTESISIIIPALNEAKNIGGLLASLTSANNVEVIVVDGGSSDDTLAIAQSGGIKALSAPAGRAQQMNMGAKVARGTILLFLHADTRLPLEFDRLVRATLHPTQQTPPIAGAFALQIDAPFWSLRAIEWGVTMRSRFLQMPYGDQAIFLRAETFHQIGGFPDLPIMEDFELMCRLRSMGQIEIIPVPVVTSARRWIQKGVFWTTLMNQLIVLAYLLRVSPEHLLRWYRQGKLW